MAIIHLTKQQFQQEILSAEQTVVLDFWASWCGPCQMMAPVLEQLADARPDLLICKVDVDQEPELAEGFQISSIPTLVVMKQGKVLKKEAGLKPFNQLLSWIDQ